MKTSLHASANRMVSLAAVCTSAALVGTYSLSAGESSAAKSVVPTTAAEEPYNNWIEFGLGGVIYHGNRAAGQERLQVTDDGLFGGITDMHMQKDLPNKWTATLDGHAIFNNDDFDLRLNIEKPDVGYLRAGFSEFKTYYNGAGGFYPNVTLPGDGVRFEPFNDEFSIQRGDVWVELGLRVPHLPQVTFRYDHIWRFGQKDSTSWGDSILTGNNLVTNSTRKIVPAFRNINEVRDIFALDISKTIGITDIGVGVRWELTRNDDSFNTLFRPGEYNSTNVGGVPTYPDVKLDRYLTQTDSLKSDLFSAHATTETRFNEKVWLTTGYSFTTLNSDIAGDRIYGPRYDSPYIPLYGVSKVRNLFLPELPLAATASGRGYLHLLGGAEMNQNEFNINFLWIPVKDLSVITGFRFDKEDTTAVSAYDETNYNTGAKAYYTAVKIVKGKPTFSSKSVTYLQPTIEPWDSSSKHTLEKLAESIELRYTGLKDWLLYTRCELDEDNENVDEIQNEGFLIQQYIADPNKKALTLLPTDKKAGKIDPLNASDSFYDSRRLTQKWSSGFNWYPFSRLSFSAQYFHRLDANDYNAPMKDGYIYSQNFATDNVNFRVTAHPLSNLTLVSRYDFQRTQSFTSAQVLGPENSATCTSHMFSENATWNPLDRIYVQGNLAYVINKTNTKAQITVQDETYYPVDPKTGLPTISTSTGLPSAPWVTGNPTAGPVGLSFKNNYWEASLGVGYAVDDRTDLRLDYSYYRANDYGNNDLFGSHVVISQPYGAGQEEQTVSATFERQLCRNTRLTLRYSFTSSRDETSYGGNNFNAHMLFTGLLVRF